jgi:tetratricopeptide (TPR) repeat protein
MNKFPLILACVAVLAGIGRAQNSEPDVKQLVDRINSGQSDQVRNEIPSLLSRYPNNAGVLYVQALVTRDAAEAVRIYQSIVDNFPKSEWADASLYRVYQFYYALGLYRTAELKLSQLKKDYPQSRYIAAAGSRELADLPDEKDSVRSPVVPTHRPDSVETVRVVAPPSVTGSPSQFTLQVGAYTAPGNADRQKQFFENLGYSVEVMSKIKDTRSLFIVLVGSYGTYDEAKAKGAELKQKYNIDSIVISK